MIYIGKIVNTHGIKGELRIISNFSAKDKVFIQNMPIYINNQKEIINTYRRHKMFDMITLKNYNDINQVLKYKGKKVYIAEQDLNLNKDEYILEELLGYKIIENNELLGEVSDITYNNGNDLLTISGKKNFYIPYNNNFIKEVDKEKKEIIVENAKGLIL